MMMNAMMDPKKKAIEELMAHLDMKDGEDLGSAMKPKAVEVAAISDDGAPEPDGDESPGVSADGSEVPQEGSEPKLSDEEIAELIEALQSKMGG